jgi:hypothetical protein
MPRDGHASNLLIENVTVQLAEVCRMRSLHGCSSGKARRRQVCSRVLIAVNTLQKHNWWDFSRVTTSSLGCKLRSKK